MLLFSGNRRPSSCYSCLRTYEPGLYERGGTIMTNSQRGYSMRGALHTALVIAASWMSLAQMPGLSFAAGADHSEKGKGEKAQLREDAKRMLEGNRSVLG